MSNKKRIERIYLNEARAASSLFPAGEPVPHEPLDFLFETPSRLLGVEITELCHEDARKEGARLGYVVPKAKKLYDKRLDAKPVSVSPVLSHDADTMHVDVLATGLADFVYNHRAADNTFDWYHCEDIPKGFSQIGVFPPWEEIEPEGKWRHFRAFSTTLLPKDAFDARIAEKNARLNDYRQIAPEVWLLLVNDLFLGPGEVAVRVEDLKHWTFDFDFDKVLFFERQPGGTGKIIELLRANRSVETLHSHA
jgi:hypothetical protein